ncbi:hypothetical protein [Spiroplasma cantharicola]|uniref:Uncharacterized protein n=1 Tax=Spiroplasma cantharicola TaxID=362837 RepID=A0A0M4KD00_9MOLU|nr:hypothetical protein [Spiroplasma cantharicola]ALD66702.1 hypothetical protein SCANT_v1c07960 [Spiroplasma cantharicola]
MIFLTYGMEITNTILTAISTVTVFAASLLIPFLVKKYNDKKQKLDIAEKAILDAFDKYFSDEYSKNDFEWYLAEVNAILKRYEINSFLCTNCKKKCNSKKYMLWFEKVDKTIPEINNFSFKTGRMSFKIELTTLFCYKCTKKKVTKKALTN